MHQFSEASLREAGDEASPAREPAGCLTASWLVDAALQVSGYRLGWQAARPAGGPSALQAAVRAAAEHLVHRGHG